MISTKRMPVVSLVMTVYNMERYIERALKSVLAQTFESWELIIWDDGSTDGSAVIAQCYAAKDKRIRFYLGEENVGQGQSLQQAHALTQGEFVGWLDADDWLAPTALEESAQCLRQHSTYGMVYTDHIDVDEKGVQRGLGYRCQIPFSPQRMLVDLLIFHFRLVRQSVFAAVGGFNLEIECAEDYDLFLRISEITPVYHLRRPLYFYLRNSQGLSAQRMRQQRQGSAMAVSLALKRRGLADAMYLKVDDKTGKFQLVRYGKHRLAEIAEAKALFAQGVEQMRIGDFAQAVDYFKQSIVLRGDYIAAHNQLGKAYQLMGLSEQAEETFEKLLKINPHLAQAHCNLGAIWQVRGELEGAIAAYRKAIALKPDLAVAQTNLANVLVEKESPVLTSP